jgi:hypothetical protein
VGVVAVIDVQAQVRPVVVSAPAATEAATRPTMLAGCTSYASALVVLTPDT